LFSQKKVTKEKATHYRLFPHITVLTGGNRKLANKNDWLKQPELKIPHFCIITGAVNIRFNFKIISIFNIFSYKLMMVKMCLQKTIKFFSSNSKTVKFF